MDLFRVSTDFIPIENEQRINKSKLFMQGVLPQLYNIFNKKLSVV